MNDNRSYTSRTGQVRPYNGPNPGVAPGANYGITGSAAPDQWNNPTVYPPTASGTTQSKILPSWLHAAVEGFKHRLRAAVAPSTRNQLQAPNQGFGANAVVLPAGQAIPFRASPMQYNRYMEGTQPVGYGGSMDVMFSTISNRQDDMPAFQISPPMGGGRSFVNYYEGLNFFSPARSGVPTFFPVGNRSLQSNVGGGVDNHPVGVSYLVIPPDRYRRPNRAQPVRGKTGQSRGNISRMGTTAMVFGS